MYFFVLGLVVVVDVFVTVQGLALVFSVYFCIPYKLVQVSDRYDALRDTAQA